MMNFALYRLPHKNHCTRLVQSHGEPLVLNSLLDLNGQEGFVIAPFHQQEDCPLLLLKPDVIEEIDIPENTAVEPSHTLEISSDQDSYIRDFSTFHSQLQNGAFSKIVLSRCCQITASDSLKAEELFMKACRLYPRMFVALVSTALSGTWLMASPEILLEGDGSQWHTMALAGTMKLDGDDLNTEGENTVWSNKNKEEQQYVAEYIHQQLLPFARNIVENGPYTARAANLVHLRSDFTFTLNDSNSIGNLLQNLHPTPAVCGLPKAEAMQFILEHEYRERKYYSGFVGMLNPHGNTHLYVNLRSMQILDHEYHLYAGGGLLRESECDKEWQETENKLNTMKNVLR